MPVSPEQAGFVQQAYRSAIWEDPAVRSMYGKVARDTGENPIPTYFDDIADAQAMADERGALLSGHARAFTVTVQDLDVLDSALLFSETLPAVTLVDDELVANLDCAVIAVASFDMDTGQTQLVLWGTY